MNMQEDSTQCAVSCSWDSKCPWVHIFTPTTENDWQAQVETIMDASHTSSDGGEVALAVVPTVSGAPWIDLTLSASLLAVCVTTNARVLEVHNASDCGADSGYTRPLLTHEGVDILSSNSGSDDEGQGNWFAHYLCGGQDSDSVLLPGGGRRYRLKLFARCPQNHVGVRCCCVVTAKSNSEATTDITDDHESPSETLGRTAALGGYDVSALLRQTLSMQMQMQAHMGVVLERLERVEARLDAVDRIQSANNALRLVCADAAIPDVNASNAEE